ncbi:MAG: 1-deoxy-D-xylulose-5-phosphate reductoisomerase [Pseudomonadota bacterium]
MTETIRLSIMGATGSIGTSAAQVIEEANSNAPLNAPAFEVEALVAGRAARPLIDLAKRLKPQLAVLAHEDEASLLAEGLAGHDIEVASGTRAVIEAATRPCDKVLAAISGSEGLASTLAAVRQGTTVALANKESIVCGGGLILSEAKAHGAKILPVDSEHNAIFQVLHGKSDVEGLTITASGGPFLSHSREDLASVTVEQAMAHPNWDMGVKNSIDSATLMNKALEFIEAAYLFDLAPDKINVVVHPQSIVHGMAHYLDGSVLAQLGVPDMRTPIAHALAWPRRVATSVKRLDLAAIGALEFETVDKERFPAVEYARWASSEGPAASTMLNSANEAAVTAFISGACGFLDISSVVGDMLDKFDDTNFRGLSCMSLEEIEYLNARTQAMTLEALGAAALDRRA